MKGKDQATIDCRSRHFGGGTRQVVSTQFEGLLPGYIRQQTAVALVVGLAALLTVVNLEGSQPWNLCTPPVPLYNQWQAAAASADASTLIAAGYTFEPLASGPGTTPIYVSTNSGATWVTNGAPSQAWQAVACSADGTVLVAVAQGAPYDGSELIYTSTNSGVTWNSSAPTNVLGWAGNTWSSVAASAGGTRLVATAVIQNSPVGGAIVSQGDGLIYISTNSGAAWLPSKAPTNQWISVALSADGARVVAASGNGTGWGADGFIYHSSNGGATWTRTSANSNDWVSIASSADGTVLLAASTTANSAGDGLIYASRDSGGSWSPTTAPNDDWTAVALSADGSIWIAAAIGSGRIYISTDFGSTWSPADAPYGSWASLATSADGYKVIAGSSDGWLCTLPYSGPWRFASAPANGAGLIVSSADSTKLLLAAANQLFTSSSAGTTWTPTGPSDQWVSLASSADGAKLFAAATSDCNGGDGLIYASADSGATWNPTTAPSNQWHSIACSADGHSLIAATIFDRSASNSLSRIYTSRDAGATWTPTSASTGGGANGDFAAVAMSADGTKAVATTSEWFSCFGTPGRNNYLIYISTNSASSWTRAVAPANQWSCVASAADGSKLIAGAYGHDNAYGDGSLYTSADSGATWNPTRAPYNNWTSVASSTDGTRSVAVAATAYESLSAVYISTNSGAAWTPAGSPAWSWNSAASSADGSNVVVVGNGFIGILQSPPPAPPVPPSPQLSLALSATNLSLSWLVPSTPFVLQQSSNLNPTTWVDLPANHTLILTNLHYQVTLRPSLSANFYRLRQQ